MKTYLSRLKDSEKYYARHAGMKKACVDYKGGKCQHCGYNKCLYALVFHHTDPSKKDFNISKARSITADVQRELDKCLLLCCNCHSEEHDRLRQEARSETMDLLIEDSP